MIKNDGYRSVTIGRSSKTTTSLNACLLVLNSSGQKQTINKHPALSQPTFLNLTQILINLHKSVQGLLFGSREHVHIFSLINENRMKGNLLIQRYKSQIRIFRHSNGKISVGPEMEAIHQFRIAIKRIRVLLNLMEKVSRSEFRQEEHLILFGSLYREAGKLREAQINDSLLRSSGVDFPAAYMDYLHNIRTTAGQRLQEQILKFDFQKLSDLEAELENKIDPIPEKDIIEDAETEVLYQLRVIRKLRKKPSKRKNLHPIRIRLKGVIELLNLIMDSSGRADLTPLEEGCTRLSKELGKWHDLEMLLRSLREFGLQKHDDKPIREKVRKTIKLIHRDSVKQRKRIGKSLVKELP